MDAECLCRFHIFSSAMSKKKHHHRHATIDTSFSTSTFSSNVSSSSSSSGHTAPAAAHSPRRPLTLLLVLSTLLLFSLPLTSAQQSCTNTAGCFPPIGNLALGRTIQTNSTCTQGDLFCLFLSNNLCQTCSPDEHSPQSLNDDDNSTLWVSAINPESQPVSLQLDFEGPVFFRDMTLVWQSVHPVAMVLERSCDYGETWSVYRYYALNCQVAFMLEDTFIDDNTPPFNGTAPICTSVQTEILLFSDTDSVMTFSTLEHIPRNSQEASCYQTITNIRVLMLDFFPEVLISNSSFHYYGVREWIVRGSCMCNGHADTCVPGPGEEESDPEVAKVYTGCMCQHNTVSPNCDQCLSGFNGAPFRPGTPEEANICETCMCNGHSSDCQIDTSQLVPVCINCTDNTAGAQCDECISGYYQDPMLLLNDPNICRECGCVAAGITDTGLCDSFGQCNCKTNVMSLQCDECRSGFYNLSASNLDGCQMCDCDPFGSELNSQGIPRCNGVTGECVCRPTAEGERCDLCQPGSYDLTNGCPTCDCDVGGSTGPVCDQDSPVGQCPCKPNIQGTRCNTPTPGYYFITLDTFAEEAEDILLPQDIGLVLPIDETYGAFTGRGFVSLPPDTDLMFTFSPPRDSRYELIIRFSTRTAGSISTLLTLSALDPLTTSFNCSSASLLSNSTMAVVTYPSQTLTLDQLFQGYFMVDSVCLEREVEYQLTLSFTSSTTAQLLVDSLILLPDVSATSAFYASFAGQAMQEFIQSCLPRAAASDVVRRLECEGVSFTLATEFLGEDPLIPCDCDPDGTVDVNITCMAFGGGCGLCQPGVTGRQCDMCMNGFFDLAAGGCEACGCDPTGSLSPICTDTGQCSCKPGVGRATCDACLPNHFNFTSEGCTPCACSMFSTSSSCDVTTGQCPCPERTTGRTCDVCTPDSFNLTSNGCQPCNCSNAGSISDVCDDLTGQCQCTGNLMGLRCDQCPDGFFNTGEVTTETCSRCVCSGRSDQCSLNPEESRLEAVSFSFSQLCSSDPTTCDDGWRLIAGETESIDFGPNDFNGLGYILSINMMPMVFVHPSFLGNRLSSYGLNFTVSITIISAAPLNNSIIVRMRSSMMDAYLIGSPYVEMSANGLEDSVFLNFTISLVESNWRFSDETSPSLLQFLSFISNITEISYTADYTEDFIEFVFIREVSLLLASSPSQPTLPPSSTPPPSSPHLISLPSTIASEECSCPPAYQGSSCESCARGYARPSGNIADNCTFCECNGQTLDCDVETAVCLNCGGNTTGDGCERCLDGFYGDPTRGIPCLPCECPLTDDTANSFSPTCFLDPADDLPTCDMCEEGYSGRNCEICMEGYFGNPRIGICNTCDCNGNMDPALGPVCDMTSGRCLNCQNNTEGFFCELCVPNYFGDPGTDIPCQPCPCDARGTDGYCDPLLGTCPCLPNVMGERCDSCRPGFFNINSGRGCMECSCDTDGSLTSECDQVSGDCSCLPNVGSSQDNKCNNCTPGYFNFTAGIGCEACNCSELAVSDECDDTGRCVCQEGAVGLKCNDCAFGFFGQVPNCEECHDCFFQWHDVLTDFSVRAGVLESNLQQLVETYYNGHTEESLSAEIAVLTGQLAQVNATLNNITLEGSDVEELERILDDLNATLTTFTAQLRSIERDLDGAERILEIANEFDGTVNMSDVEDLQRRLQAANSTAIGLSLAANASLAQLVRDQETVSRAWNGIEELNDAVADILANLTEAEDSLEPINTLISSINATEMDIKRNLTFLDMQADRLAAAILMLTERSGNVSMDISSAESILANLTAEIQLREQVIQDLLVQIEVLNETVLRVERAAADAHVNAGNLMVAAEGLINAASSTLQNITATIDTVTEVADNLTQVLDIASAISSIRLPSLDTARLLAARIMQNIVPDEAVEGIMEDVRATNATVMQALALAQNASDTVMAAQAVVTQIQEDINCTNTTQLQVQELLDIVQERINEVQTDLDQISSLGEEFELVSADLEASLNSTALLIEEVGALGVSTRARANQLLDQATGNASEAEDRRNGLRELEGDLGGLAEGADVLAQDASALLTEAQRLNDEVDTLETEANRIAIADINALLADYEEELARTTALQQRIEELTQEAETLTETFNHAAYELQQCYRTP